MERVQEIDLSVRISGLYLRNPTVLASGILGSSHSLLKRVEEAGAGALTTKTITPNPREGYPNPVFVDLGYACLNAIGLRNPGSEEFSRELAIAKRLIAVPIIASIGGTGLEDFILVAERMLEAGCDALEVNLSCPHVKGFGLDIGLDLKLTRRIIRELKSISSRPVFVKISTHHSLRNMIESYVGEGVDGFVAINAVKGMAIDVRAKAPILHNVVGGLTGPCIKPIALAVVYEIHSEFPEIPIIGVGGVEKAEDAVEMMMAGASAVGVGTAIVRRDLKVFEEIVTGIGRYMSENGFKSVRELVGYIHRR